MLNKDAYEIYVGLSQINNLNIPARVAFALVRNKKLLEPIVQTYVEVKDNLLRTYGIEDENEPGKFTIPPEKVEQFSTELTGLNYEDNEVLLQKIRMSDIESLNLSLQMMETLYPMIEEEL